MNDSIQEPVACPRSAADLADELSALGVEEGMVLLVHCSLSRVGRILGGGPQALIEALLSAVGPNGTVMMPTHNAQHSNPANWQRPPVHESDWARVRDAMPVWDAQRTPSWQMGVLAETFRTWPGTRRSNHPSMSFAALGPAAEQLTASHAPGHGFGEQSPIGELYALDGHVLLIGVAHGNNTSIHLAEQRASWPDKYSHTEGARMRVDGESRWVEFEELAVEDDDFVTLGAEYERETGAVTIGKLGDAETRLLRQRPLVDWATTWMAQHR